jgi:hypothetical protein
MITYDIIIGFTRPCSEWMSRRRCGRSLILTDKRIRQEVFVNVREFEGTRQGKER